MLKFGSDNEAKTVPALGVCQPLDIKALGSASFCKKYRLEYPYVAGAMAKGITSAEMVEKMSRAGMLGMFGSAGLPITEVEDTIIRFKKSLDSRPFGINLIYSPQESSLEMELVKLYIHHGVSLISASAYMDITLPLVYFRLKGLYRNDQGQLITPNNIIAKISRVEVARKFFAPPPEKLVKKLLDQALISPEEAELAGTIPMATDITAEADSGGHTDNRPAMALLPSIMAVRDEQADRYHFQDELRVGLAGGIATPTSAYAAFSMGAAYIVTGSVNQSCVESGTSPEVRKMLAETAQADVTMAPAADMFEMGVQVQVLKRGTMFPITAKKLYQFYTNYNQMEEIPPQHLAFIEKNVFRCSWQEEWLKTEQFLQERNPKWLERAATNPKYKMALLFRSYLGQASGWANSGHPDRKVDYQVWCGPAMGAFNEWVQGSFLQKTENRDVVTVAFNLLYGATVQNRLFQLEQAGVKLSSQVKKIEPLSLAEIKSRLNF